MSSVYLGLHTWDHCHGLALTLWGHRQGFVSPPRHITPDTVNIVKMIITGFRYCVYLFSIVRRWIKTYSQVLYRLRYAASLLIYLKLDVFGYHPILVFWVENNKLSVSLIQFKQIRTHPATDIGPDKLPVSLGHLTRFSFGSIAIQTSVSCTQEW